MGWWGRSGGNEREKEENETNKQTKTKQKTKNEKIEEEKKKRKRSRVGGRGGGGGITRSLRVRHCHDQNLFTTTSSKIRNLTSLMFRHCSISYSFKFTHLSPTVFRRPRVQDSVQLSISSFLQCPNPCRLFASIFCLHFLFCSTGHGFWSGGNYSAAAVENSQHRLGNFPHFFN